MDQINEQMRMREDQIYQHLCILETEIGNISFIRTKERTANPKRPSTLPIKFKIRYNALPLSLLPTYFSSLSSGRSVLLAFHAVQADVYLSLDNCHFTCFHKTS